jgi:hypothetical protein
MSLTPNEAAQALREIERTGRRSASAYGYAMASPHLILWGIIWVIGYGAGAIRPQWSFIWTWLALGGAVLSFWLGYRVKPAGSKPDWRHFATFVAVFAFIFCLFAIMPPRNPAQVGAFFPIMVALFYTLVGIWTRGTRVLVTGVLLAALTVGGYFWLPQYFLAWMAVVGGGGLILGGIWLRSV